VPVATETVVTVKVAVLEPAVTVTEAGTDAAALSELSVTAEPPVGALPVRVTVPVELLLPITVVGLSETPDTPGGVIVRGAVREPTASVSLIFAVVLAATGVVVTVNVAVVLPEVIVRLLGTVAAALSEDSVTGQPAVGALPVRVRVPVEVLPPTTEVGARAMVLTFGALTVRFAVVGFPVTVAVMTIVLVVD